MDTVDLDLKRQKAGAEYLVALKKLGLSVDALFWTFDRTEQRFVLILATEMFDLKGPLAVSELLFKAYNAAATPQEIDPFVVRLHSPDHALIRALDGWKIAGANGVARYGLAEDQKHLPPAYATIDVTVDGIDFHTAWVYRFELPKKMKIVDLRRRWRRFSANVDKLAA